MRCSSPVKPFGHPKVNSAQLLALLKILALGNQDIEAGRVKSVAEVVDDFAQSAPPAEKQLSDVRRQVTSLEGEAPGWNRHYGRLRPPVFMARRRS